MRNCKKKFTRSYIRVKLLKTASKSGVIIGRRLLCGLFVFSLGNKLNLASVNLYGCGILSEANVKISGKGVLIHHDSVARSSLNVGAYGRGNGI